MVPAAAGNAHAAFFRNAKIPAEKFRCRTWCGFCIERNGVGIDAVSRVAYRCLINFRSERMSSIDGIGLGGHHSHAHHIRQLQQSLFDKIDGDSDGSISKTELEQAVTSAGGTAQSADALFSLLDPKSTGSVTKQQFTSSLFGPPYSSQVGATLIADQSQQTSGTQSCDSGSGACADPGSGLAQAVFAKIDSDGDGSISKAELEQAGAQVGATTQAADSLYAQLDPNSTGKVDAQTFTDAFTQALRAHHHHGHHQAADSASTDSSASTSTSSTSDANPLDAVTALLKGTDSSQSLSDILKKLFAQIDSDGNGSISKTELQNAVTSAGGTASAADALFAQLDPGNTGSVSADTFTQFL
jgi:Ca2+-binding EF-hand superfamily protein